MYSPLRVLVGIKYFVPLLAGQKQLGKYLAANAGAVAKLDVGQMGELTVPAADAAVAAERTSHAFIWAPPHRFFVETPSHAAGGWAWKAEARPRSAVMLWYLRSAVSPDREHV
jgi:hypothetical protein